MSHLITEFLCDKITPVHVIVEFQARIADIASMHKCIQQKLNKKKKKNWDKKNQTEKTKRLF